MTKEKINQILKETFNPVFLQVIDESHKHAGHAGAREGGHYDVVIVADAFEGKKLLERHRMIYDAVKPIKGLIHALAIQAKSPSEVQ